MAGFVGKVQAQLNDYKYIVVPKKFDGFKKDNQHHTSTLIKHLLTQKGFEAVYDDNLPKDLNKNRCLGLFVGLDDGSSMFTTRATLVLKDCSNKEVFVTQQGKSKKKEYKDAYKEVLTEAFRSFDGIQYAYRPENEQEGPVMLSFKNDVKKLEEKPKFNKYQDPMVKQEATLDNQSYEDRRPVASDIKKAEAGKNKMIEQKATREEQSYRDRTPVESDIKKAEAGKNKMIEQKATREEQSYRDRTPVESDIKKAKADKGSNVVAKGKQGVLYAQELSNGYQLVDSTPEIRFRIYKSSMPNVYLAKTDSKDGMVYTVAGKWFFEYSENGNLVVEELNIKF